MSPRSGTPVKLLGREDASVDWYNLEKSKRVKAFRCGEFDACIERAEASHGIPIKKREKYARREDAILHALELEKQQLDMNHLKHGTVSNGVSIQNSGDQRRELNRSSSNIHTRDDEHGVDSNLPNHKSLLFSRKVVLSREEENGHMGRSTKQSGWEEEISETFPRMRGLQDFGLKIAPNKKKLSQSVAWETSKPLEIQLGGLSTMGHMARSASHKSSLAIKRNRSLDGHGEDSLVRKRDRRRPLQQVLKSSAKLPISLSFQSEFDTGGISMQGERDHVGTICRAKRSSCVYLPSNSNETMESNGYSCEEMPSTGTPFVTDNSLDYRGPLSGECSSSSETADETESDSPETDYLEPDMEEDGNLISDVTRETVPGSKIWDCPAAQAPENFGDLNGDEMPLPVHLPSLHPQAHLLDASADSGISKWHMKGKRNVRNITKRPLDLIDGGLPFSNTNNSNGSTKGASGSRGSSFKVNQPVSNQSFPVKKDPIYHDENKIRKDLGYSNRRYPFAFQGIKDRRRSQSGFNDSDNDSHSLSPSAPHMLVKMPCWEESEERFDCGDEMEPILFDVDIKVQNPSHQGEHVPFVSLMSRLNGKQILGHPVQIEKLQDGSSSHIVSKYEETSAPPAFGRTAKRSAMHRIPRGNPVLDDDDDADLLDSDQEFKPSSKKANAGYFSNQARLAKKSISQARRPSRKVSFSSQKTKTLSSLGTESGSLRLRRGSDLLDGLVKPEGGVPLVTCVPVKVAFSRILEAIGRPSSVSAHRARMTNPAFRGAS